MLDKTPEGGNKKGEKHSCNKLGQEGGVAVGADFMSVRSPERANVMRKSYDLEDLYRFVRFLPVRALLFSSSYCYIS